MIVDSDAGHYRRKIIAFVGGLDLCMGRYDTPQHPLFRTLQTVHKDDFYNPTFTVIFQLMFLAAIRFNLVAPDMEICLSLFCYSEILCKALAYLNDLLSM